MIGFRACAFFICAIAAATMPGCALFSKSEKSTARFFSLERVSDRPGPAQTEVPGARGNSEKLRLGRVTGAPHLEERIVFHNSEYEIGYYQDRRWTEPPERFLKRLLARVLFEERGLRQVVGGAGPTLDVQLVALDEIRGPQHLARAQVVARLHDERLVLWEETLTVDRPVVKGGDRAAATVQALGEALKAVVDQIADRVMLKLEERERTTARF